MTRSLKATERLFSIANYISRHPGVTARELSERYHVSRRSIYRDIQRLEQIGIQVISTDGGYMLIEEPTKFSADLNTEEYLALTFSPLLANREFQRVYHRALDKIFSRIRVNEEALRKMRSLSHKIRIQQGRRGVSDADHLEKVMEALVNNRSIDCVYYVMYRDEISERVIDPYYLVPRLGHLYLIGYCHSRKEIRTFRLNRFKKIELTKRTFTMIKGFDIDEYLDKVWGMFRDEEEETFEIRFSKEVARYIKEVTYETEPTITDLPDGAIHFKVTIRGANEFLRWVRQFGKEAEILAPKKYRDEMLKEIKELEKIYRCDTTCQ